MYHYQDIHRQMLLQKLLSLPGGAGGDPGGVGGAEAPAHCLKLLSGSSCRIYAALCSITVHEMPAQYKHERFLRYGFVHYLMPMSSRGKALRQIMLRYGIFDLCAPEQQQEAPATTHSPEISAAFSWAHVTPCGKTVDVKPASHDPANFQMISLCLAWDAALKESAKEILWDNWLTFVVPAGGQAKLWISFENATYPLSHKGLANAGTKQRQKVVRQGG